VHYRAGVYYAERKKTDKDEIMTLLSEQEHKPMQIVLNQMSGQELSDTLQLIKSYQRRQMDY